MTKTLVSYYSLTNNTRKIAELIAQTVDANSERILDAQERESFFGMMRSGYQVLFKRQGHIQPTKEDVTQFDLIIIGTPVWG